MPVRARPGPYTFADFLERVNEDQKADLIDGAIYMASPENTEHNTILRWLDKVLWGYIDEAQLGYVSIEKIAYRLTRNTAPEPDLVFVAADRRNIVKDGYVDGAPDLVVEIVSPESVQRDYQEKRAKYEVSGVREYWIIDPEEQKITLLTHGPAGFVEVAPEGTLFRSKVVPGFTLDADWVWQRPLPSPFVIVPKLLADARS